MAAVTEKTIPELDHAPLGRIQYWFACFFAAGWTAIVCAGLGVQFISWDYPCPLCMIQRMFMLLAALGAAYIVRKGLTGTITRRDYMMGWGLALVGSMGGAFAAWRQTMLHILPGDEGYGSPVLGLHMYVWAWILFMASVVAVGIVLAFAHHTTDRHVPTTGISALLGRAVLWFIGLVIAVNLVVVFGLEGFNWFLPDDPQRYELFYQLGILG
ncbi:disulfide bond formation protein B [Streptomyces sp. NPDC002851]